jgi:hypothetical protein
MPRPVAIRANYRNDAAFLLRLEEAIGLDPTMRNTWKRSTNKLIRKVVHKLLSAEIEKSPRSSKNVDVKRQASADK